MEYPRQDRQYAFLRDYRMESDIPGTDFVYYPDSIPSTVSGIEGIYRLIWGDFSKVVWGDRVTLLRRRCDALFSKIADDLNSGNDVTKRVVIGYIEKFFNEDAFPQQWRQYDVLLHCYSEKQPPLSMMDFVYPPNGLPAGLNNVKDIFEFIWGDFMFYKHGDCDCSGDRLWGRVEAFFKRIAEVLSKGLPVDEQTALVYLGEAFDLPVEVTSSKKQDFTEEARYSEVAAKCTLPRTVEVPSGGTIEKCDQVLTSLGTVLAEKNKRYGDSALHPVNVFVKGDVSPAGISLCARLNDKVARIQNSAELRKNDVCDLMGYLTLLCVEKNWLDFSDLID